jgi:ABC-type enterochelin transport system permease subunit
MGKINFWDILFWIAMIILILYIIGKLAGIINTPEWVDLIPLITLVFIMGAFYQKISGFMETMANRTNYLKNNLDKISDRLIEQDKRISSLEGKRK